MYIPFFRSSFDYQMQKRIEAEEGLKQYVSPVQTNNNNYYYCIEHAQ